MQQPTQSRKLLIRNGFLVLVLILSLISSFATGYFVHGLLTSQTTKPYLPENRTNRIPISTSPLTPTPASEDPQLSTQFLPGKFYFNDTIFVIARNTQRQTLIATAARTEQDSAFEQSSRVSYFDGNAWHRVSTQQSHPDATIVSNKIIRKWELMIDPSRVLKESVQGEMMIDGITASFVSDTFTNEIVMRSLPGYTKLMSVTSGKIRIGTQEIPADILYSRIYSLNAADIQFYNEPLGLTTDWIAFWASDGSFYHVDATKVEKPTSIYQTHQIAVRKDAVGNVNKTFTVTVQRDTNTPPSNYNISLPTPITATIELTNRTSVNKAPNNSFDWYMSTVDGVLTREDGSKISGFGLAEYIHN
jgi:hypothetical protein